MAIEFIAEYSVGGTLEAPTLVKDRTTTLLSAYVPARAALGPIDFYMYATPPPLGYTYNQYRAGGVYYPNSAETFANWSQLKRAPTEYVSTVAGYTYKTVEELFGDDFSGSVSIPANWSPVYKTVSAPDGQQQQLVGYNIPVMRSEAQPPRYYGPIAHMDYVVFPDVATAANGYPLASSTVRGYFDVPTAGGDVRVWGDYVKDARGVWMRVSGDPFPAYCSQGGSCRVVMLADFPGRAEAAAVPAEYSVDHHIGWNAGANSLETYDGDVVTQFSVAIAAAGAVGFAPAGPRAVGDYRSLTHCFYFDTDAAGARQYRVMERGRGVGPRTGYAATDQFEIRRELGVVTYLAAGAVVHVSGTPSGGELMVGTALYCAGDGVY